ncbi:exported hypothetical protein [Cupriavidus necator]|uniref:Extra-cytoplasmic solute receptor n=1 Tax=Cupriavidus necator TaxID=106590 RepID=A0A1K0JSQ3_CUPNE|nr:exported hypothetical protein [Cupriavidus necator]
MKRLNLKILCSRSTAIAVMGLTALHAAAQSEAYPTHPIQLVVPSAVAGAADQLARMVSGALSGALKQQVVVINAPGASGVIGVQKVTSAKADGYTVLFGFNQLTTINPHLIPNLRYTNLSVSIVTLRRIGTPADERTT